MNILALDLSTKRSGWAVKCGQNEVEYGVIASSAADVEKRIGIMRDGVIDLINKYNIDIIIAEEVRPENGESTRRNAHTEKVLLWLQGIIAIAAYEQNSKIKYELIGASSWRSKLGIQGYRVKREEQKKIDIDFANKKYNLKLTTSQDDEADALGILTSYIEKGNEKPTGAFKEESAF